MKNMTLTNKRIAFHGDKNFKSQLLAEAEEHRKQDRYVKGTYHSGDESDFRGCSVGCCILSLKRLRGIDIKYNDRDGMGEAIGVPTVLIRLQDQIFEALPLGEHAKWTGKFFHVIQPGADLSMVWPRFAHYLLVNPEIGVLRRAKTETDKQAVERGASLYLRCINGDQPSDKEWRDAKRLSDYDYVAYVYADYLYFDDAYLDERKKFFTVTSEKLLLLMAEAPVVI